MKKERRRVRKVPHPQAAIFSNFFTGKRAFIISKREEGETPRERERRCASALVFRSLFAFTDKHLLIVRGMPCISADAHAAAGSHLFAHYYAEERRRSL